MFFVFVILQLFYLAKDELVRFEILFAEEICHVEWTFHVQKGNTTADPKLKTA